MKPINHKSIQRICLRGIILCTVCFVIPCHLYYLSIWYRIPHKELRYKTEIAGCVGYPSCTIYLGMDYSDVGSPQRERIGAILSIKHPFRKHSPFLFRDSYGFTMSESRKDRYKKYYEPLYQYDSLLCDKISTVYSSHLEMSSNLYDAVTPKDEEYWFQEHLLTTRKFKTERIKANGTSTNFWFYLERLPSSCPCDEGSVVLCAQLCNSIDNFKPVIKSKGDISKLDCEIFLDIDSRMACDSIIINTIGSINLISSNITPDSVTFNELIFIEPYKISKIREDGLKFYAEFPEAQKLQNLRIAVLILFLPFWVTLLIRLICKELRRFKIYRKHNQIHRKHISTEL